MSEEQQAPQAGAEAQAQEAAEGQQEHQQDGGERVREPQGVEELPRWARDEIKNLRKENGARRAAQKEQRDQEASDLQNVSGERDALREERDALREENEGLTRQVRRAAFIERIGLPNARAAWGYVLDGTVSVDFDDDNRPQKLDAVRKALREEDPSLFGNGSADGGAGGIASGGYTGAPGRDRLAHAYGRTDGT